MKIKKSDTILVISGKYKGKVGKVEKTLPKGHKILVAGVNILKKHSRSSKKNPKGGIIEVEAPIDISNVKIICSKCSKATRVGYKIINHKKTSICRKCKEEI